MFEYRDELDELRRHESAWIASERAHAMREQRKWEMRALLCTRVLDERHQLGPEVAAQDGVSEATVRRQVDTARALESLSEIAAAAYEGRLSAEQLAPVVALADESSDGEWARRAQGCAPQDLARLARAQRTPTREEGVRRREARQLRTWWAKDRGMFCGRFELADVDGAYVESVVDDMIERMRPARGKSWDSREHRGADALVQLCRTYEQADPATITGGRPAAHLVVHVPVEGPAEVAGIPLPDDVVESLRTQARLEPVLVEHGAPVVMGRVRSAVSEKIKRAILLRDGHRCRCGTCDTRHGLEIHHLVSRSWGGTDDPGNLASVCALGGSSHHPMLVPTGDYVLEGNPALPDGLRLVHWTEARSVTPPPEWAEQRRRPGPARRDRTRPRSRSRAGPPAV